MSSLADAIVQSDLDVAPLLLPAQVLRNDAQAIKAAHELAHVARQQAAKRDRQRKLPWSEIEQFTRSGLGSIAIPREYGGPQVSFVTLADVFAIISAADPALGQIPQNQFGILNLVLGSATEAQKKQLFKSVLEGWRIGNAGPERGTKNTLELKARITADGDGFVISGQKFYSTGALFAHWVAVKALNDDGKQVLAFVRRGTPGLRIVDDGQAFAVARDECQLLHAVFIHYRGRDALCVDRARGVELAAVDAIAVTVASQAGDAVVGGFGAEFGKRIAEALTGQYFCVEAFFLLFAAIHTQHFEGIKMVLRNLSEGAVSLGDQGDHLGQCDVRNPGAAELFWHADAPQTRAGKHFQLRVRQTALAVAQGAVAFEIFGQVTGDDQGLLIAGDDRDVVRKSHRFLQMSGRQIQEWRAGSVPFK